MAAARKALEELKLEYEAWLDSVPESLQGGDLAECLTEAVDELDNVIETLAEIRLPRGFGRD